MIDQASNQSIASLLSGSLKTYRGNFGKLFLIFLIFAALLVLPIIISLHTYTAQLQMTVQGLASEPTFTFFYIFRPLLENGMLTLSAAAIWVVAVFATPLCIGMAGKIISEYARGRQCSMREAFNWIGKNYLKLMVAYLIYYVIFAVFGISFFYLTYWMIRDASHVIQETWLNPTITMFSVGGAALLLGTIYIPFGMIDHGKSPLRAFSNSFRVMFSKRFVYNFPHLLIAAIIACAFAFAALFPIIYEYILKFGLENLQGNILEFFKNYNDDILLICVSIVVFALAGVFLYIFAYNTYRSANLVLYRKEKSNMNYRRKLSVEQPSDRRRVG